MSVIQVKTRVLHTMQHIMLNETMSFPITPSPPPKIPLKGHVYIEYMKGQF